ncbi:dihydroneopterin aldolase [Marivibrio halodurans]|uniref:dihydroneopterin aldolase n=1 Tax=Marivibrio halodurans TaxID=2039722 RepID=A0A8J7RXB3_9PROT|nr:dihydroneopterin aldolase [Marivibrio halodurans]MBP5856457.1 dihydroneopterin aldolase [Marivibrio halodurans]
MRIVANSTAIASAATALEQENRSQRSDRLGEGSPASSPRPTPAPDKIAPAPTYRILVRDLDIAWSIGVFDHEHDAVQPIRINLELDARGLEDWEADDYAAVPCYASIAERIRALAAEGHVRLVETLAHRIAQLCLEDERILRAVVRIEKPEALKNAGSVGVEVVCVRPAGE